ncbi:hypothetical protein WA1_16500 [Scytonema hofmannii PCC 7110]|uniref:DUF3598 domain-containing protein n=1 Tax=Scytonema hofmannii PCC 7110 TaxID=128403 RepID=A0A139XAC3_9CYAN|nr:hypothetical protein [Scytonema hofmannii]KYC41647.1 hypothetical protein WA1_16500 [Scytonema hofmannii PCC 7110]
MESNLLDLQIKDFLFGKWRFETSRGGFMLILNDDYTYEQTWNQQTSVINELMQLPFGNKTIGEWYVEKATLFLKSKNTPNSFWNLDFFQMPITTALNSTFSFFIPDTYRILTIIDQRRIYMQCEETDDSFIAIRD